MSESLKQKAISGAIWSGVQKFGLSIISFVSNIFLARLLTPDDYGCIGMLSIFIAISTALIYGGFVSALIQKKDAADKDFCTVFIWNLTLSLILYLLIFYSAPAISNFYKLDKLTNILRVLGLLLLINGFSAVQTTILRKKLLFSKLARYNIISATVSVIFAIVLAYSGFGVWALVGQQLCTSTFNCLLLWYSSSWKPRMIFSIDSFKSLFGYGSFLLLNDLINNICDNFQGLLIGKKFSAASMGLYTQAKRLEEVPTQSISQMVAQVTFPIYSKIQDDKSRLYLAVKKTLSLMNFVNFPLMMMLIVIAKPLFVILYSDKWIASVPFFQILCIAGLVNCLQSVNYQVVSASGRSKELFVWNFVKRGCGIAFILFGLIFGIKGLLWGTVASFYLIYLINAKLAYKSTGYSIVAQVRDNFRIFLISLISSIAALLPSLFISNVFSLLLLQISTFLFLYLLFSKILKIQELDEILHIIKRKVQ